MSPEIETRLLEALAGGMSVTRFCTENPDAPVPQSVFDRVTRNPEFRLKFMAAKMLAADYYVDQIIDIADSTQDPKRSKIQIDTRWRLAAMLNPIVYGEKLDITSGGRAIGDIPKGASPVERIDHIISRIASARKALPPPDQEPEPHEETRKWSVLD